MTEAYGNGFVTDDGVGYGATPFKVDNAINAYVGKDGYLYGAGYNGQGAFGIGNATNQTTFVKVGTDTTGGSNSTTFKNPIDYFFGGDDTALGGSIIDSSGKVWTAGRNGNGQLGQGHTSNRTYFSKVSTGSGTNGLPSNYSAVAVRQNSDNARFILTSDGKLYGAGRKDSLGLATSGNQTSFTRLDGVAGGGTLPAATSSNPIVDFNVQEDRGGYILYKNGDLYNPYSTSATKIASNIKFFDLEGEDDNGGYIYAVTNDNKIQIYNGASLSTTINPTGTVTQVRGTEYGDWGYLNSNGDLYLTSGSNISSSGSPTGTPTKFTSNVTYFDLGGNQGGQNGTVYGVLFNDGTVKFWGYNIYGQLGDGTTTDKTFANATTPTVGGGVDPDYGNIPGPGYPQFSTPPAIDFSIQNQQTIDFLHIS